MVSQIDLVDHIGQLDHRDDSRMGLCEAMVQIRHHLNIFVMDPDESGTRTDGVSEKFAERDGIVCGTTPPALLTKALSSFLDRQCQWSFPSDVTFARPVAKVQTLVSGERRLQPFGG